MVYPVWNPMNEIYCLVECEKSAGEDKAKSSLNTSFTIESKTKSSGLFWNSKFIQFSQADEYITKICLKFLQVKINKVSSLALGTKRDY